MQKMIVDFVISGILLLILDGSYILTNLETYKKVVLQIQGTDLAMRGYLAIVFCYTCLIGGLNYFILREKRSVFDAFWFGVVIYGVYATTIFTMFRKYPEYLAVLDIFWGGVLMASTTYLTRLIGDKMI